MLEKQSDSSHTESIDENRFIDDYNKDNRNMCFFSKTIKNGIYCYQPYKIRRGKG